VKYIVILGLILLPAITLIGVIPVDAYHDDQTSRGSSDPRITVSENDAYVVWLESNNSEFGDVYFAKITNGKTVEEPVNITKGTSFYPRPQIHVAENNVYLLWEDRVSKNGNDQIFFAKSNDYGKTFSEPKSMLEEEQSFFRPSSIHQVNDVVYVFGSHWSSETQQNNIIFLKSNDFGDTFSEPTTLFNHEQSDQGIGVQVNDGIIYILSDDRNDFDEKGSIYLRKILPDGTLTDIVNVNGGKTTVTNPQFAVFEENVYVSWRDRVYEKGNFGITERWYQVFTKSHDGGKTFDDVITFDSDPDSIDTVGTEGDFVFANGNSVYVLWKSEYYDGVTQSFKIYLAYSDNKGQDFIVNPVPLNDKLAQYGSIISKLDNDTFYQIGLTTKNPPYHDAAAYFSSNLDTSKSVDILKNISLQIGWMPNFASNQNNVYFVTSGNYNKNCILYSSSNDGGKSFSDVVNISPNGNDFDCLGVAPDILSPLKQVSDGIDIQDVQCKKDITKGYILSLTQDNKPVCVTAKSFIELKNRNWLSPDSYKVFALNTAKKFIESTPRFSNDGVVGSLKLTVSSMRESLPPVVSVRGSFNLHSPGYANNTHVFGNNETYHHEIEMIITQNNKIHSAIIDDTWDEIGQRFLTDNPMAKFQNTVAMGPTKNTILSIGEPVNSQGLVPLTVTEISENVSGTVTFWQFQPIGYNGDNRGKSWDFLPRDKNIGWLFTDQNNRTDIWDSSVIPQDMYAITDDLHVYPMFCDGKEKIDGESAHPSGIPIKPGINTVHVKSGSRAFLPDPNGVYEINFATLFDTIVEFPDNANVIENETRLCVLDDTREDATHAYYTYLKFKLNGIIVNHYSESKSSDLPTIESNLFTPDGHELGDDHQHASILVKIFGDKFDFSTSQYQIMSSWIHFEGQDGNTIHRHSKGIPLGYLFDTLNLGLSSDCYVFQDKRNFCTNEDYSLKFYINGNKVSDIQDYVIMDNDRILVSYGPESEDEIALQLIELESQELIY